MAGPKDIVDALIAPQVAGKPPELANSMETLAPASQQFMDIGLMPNIPDQQIIGRIKNSVQSYRQFDDAQVRGQVAALDRNLFDDFTANFLAQLPHLLRLQTTQLRRAINAIQNPDQCILQVYL